MPARYALRYYAMHDACRYAMLLRDTPDFRAPAITPYAACYYAAAMLLLIFDLRHAFAFFFAAPAADATRYRFFFCAVCYA